LPLVNSMALTRNVGWLCSRQCGNAAHSCYSNEG
jgi:hypothetical protein